MKKITIIALMLAMSPTVLWAGGKGYARLYAKISSNSTGRGLVYASTSPDVDETKFTNEGSDQQNNPNNNVTLYAHAKAKDGFTFAGWSEKDNETIVSTDNPIAVTIKCPADGNSDSYADQTRYANFSLAECPSFAITFKATANGTYNVVGKNGADTVEIASTVVSSSDFNSGAKTHVQKLTLTATPNANCAFIGWYFIEANDSKSYFSTEASTEVSVSADTTIGADFVSASAVAIVVTPNGYDEYESLALAAVGASSGDTIKVLKSETVSCNLEVANGATLEIASGVEITVAADATLLVSGKLLNNGFISGAGTLALNYKTITQESQVNVPFPYGTDGVETGTGWDKTDGTGDGTAGKYVKTRTEVANSTAPANCTVAETQWFVTIVNGAGEPFVTAATNTKPIAVLCKVNRKTALNWITEIVDKYLDANAFKNALNEYDDTATFSQGTELSDLSYSETPDNEYMVVLVDNLTVSTHPVGFALDCAGNTYTDSATGNISGNLLYRFFNGTISISGKALRPHMNFYGCNVTTLPTFRIDYATSFSFYNSTRPSSISTDYNKTTATGPRINYYGGGPYSIDYQYYTKVYWGTFSKNPVNGSTSYIAIPNRYRVKSGTKYEIERYSGNAPHYFKIGNTEVDTLSEALSTAGANKSTIVLQKDYVINEDVDMPDTVDATLDLNGWDIGGSGTLINRGGKLDISDYSGSVVVGNVDVPVICESGSLYLAKCAFKKQITANGGKVWFISGSFSGGVAANPNVEDPLDVMEIVGGVFTSSTFTHGTESFSLLTICPNGRMSNGSSRQLAKIPEAYLSGSTTYSVVAFEDSTLYTKGLTKKKRFDYDDSDDWIIAMALSNQSAFFDKWGIDCTLVFDRDVSAGSITATSAGQTITLDDIVVANVVKSALLPKLREYSQSGSTPFGSFGPWTYGSFLPGGDHAEQISMTVNSTDEDDIGTSCSLQMRLASDIKWQSGKKDWSYDIVNGSVVIAQKRFVFGAGDKVAMLQTASGAVPEGNFFETLEAAVANDATTGKTIKLCNDCNEQVTVTKACTIDTNGFEFSGTLTAGEGLSMKTANGVYVFKAPDPVDQVNVENVVSEVVSEEWLAANEIDTTNASPADIQAAVQEVLNETDNNGNAKWQNLVIGQKADEKAAVTAANGGTDTTANIEVSFEVPKDEDGDAVNTGYTVKYAFDKADENGVVTNVTESVATTPTLDFTGVTTNTPTYFTMRAVLEATDNSGVTAEVPVEKTIGVFKVESDAAVTIIPVPWKSLGDGDIKASELVHAASLSEDDELTVYDSKGNSKSWRVNDAGKWIPVPTYETGEGQQTQQVQSQVNDDLKRGQGAILKRKDTTKEIVLIGQAVTNATETIETTIAAAGTEPSWNLVASPKLEDVDVNEKFVTLAGDTEPDADDKIMIPTAGAPRNCTFDGNTWGYSGSKKMQVMIKGVQTEVWIPARVTDNVKVPAGMGFWYINSSKDKDKKLSW